MLQNASVQVLSPDVHSSVLTHNFSSAQRTMVLEKGNRFMAPKIVRARNGSSLKAPRWVNSKSGEGQATTRRDEEEGDVEKEGEGRNPDKTDSEP